MQCAAPGRLHIRANPLAFIIPCSISGQLQSRPRPDDILFSIHHSFETIAASKGGEVIILQSLHTDSITFLQFLTPDYRGQPHVSI